MKYIILPILKFIWALILSLIVGPIYSFGQIFSCLWDFDFHEVFNFTFEDENYSSGINISPYFKTENWYKTYHFKSFYHYIWNIK